MIWELPSTLVGSCILWPAMKTHRQCMAHVIRLAIGVFIGSLGVTGCSNSWEAHECDQQFDGNEISHIAKSQRPWKEANARINKLSAMRLGLAKITENICFSRHSEWPETDNQIAENACCIDYTDTWSSKWNHCLCKSQSTNCNTIHYGCKNTVDSTLELLQRVYRLQEFTGKWVKNPRFTDCQPTSQHKMNGPS